MSKFNSDFTMTNFNDDTASFFCKIGPERIVKG